jgi:hypothetical protein
MGAGASIGAIGIAPGAQAVMITASTTIIHKVRFMNVSSCCIFVCLLGDKG